MNLAIDIGNTCIKYAIFRNRKKIAGASSDNLSFLKEGKIFKKHKGIQKAIISSVRAIPNEVLSPIRKHCHLYVMGVKTKLPFKNQYKTPKTLGHDRIAAITGAYALYPGKNVLIIDAGTCVTVDFLHADGKYFGGTISAGLNMKLKALHTFTGKLPLVSLRPPKNDSGSSTESSILTGTVNGTVAEIKASIDLYKSRYPDMLS